MVGSVPELVVQGMYLSVAQLAVVHTVDMDGVGGECVANLLIILVNNSKTCKT